MTLLDHFILTRPWLDWPLTFLAPSPLEQAPPAKNTLDAADKEEVRILEPSCSASESESASLILSHTFELGLSPRKLPSCKHYLTR